MRLQDRLTVVLVHPRNPLNIGAAARAMANFGFHDLRLVEPYDKAFREAVSAVGGASVLQSAQVFTSVEEAIGDATLVIGTTAGERRDLEHPLEPLETTAVRIQNHAHRVALLFGSEKFGLSNDDMSYCHALTRIPTVPDTPSMNLGQAVAVTLYELSRASAVPVKPAREPAPVAATDADQITKMMLDVLEQSGYTNRIVATSTERKIRRFIRRMRISAADGRLLLGILRQVLWKFRDNK